MEWNSYKDKFPSDITHFQVKFENGIIADAQWSQDGINVRSPGYLHYENPGVWIGLEHFFFVLSHDAKMKQLEEVKPSRLEFWREYESTESQMVSH